VRLALPQAADKEKVSVMSKPALTVLLAAPRGFCAGVDRAILIVERALEKWGPPVYVRHEIVHNRFVVESLRAKGAVFVDELDEVPDDAPVIFSAHGVPKSVPVEAERRKLVYVDATCPLVSKVHREAERHFFREGRHLIMIGHAGHPEVLGTAGQVPAGAVTLVETVADAERIAPPLEGGLAYVTQTTLSVDDTAAIISVLKQRFPDIHGPKQEDICYATTNRQEAVKASAAKADALLVIGSPNSSNSNRLVDVAKGAGCKKAVLVDRAADIDWNWLAGVGTLALSAGASAPEALVDEVMAALEERFTVTVSTVETAEESIEFKLPRVLVA
jgi:4-hydroxy-3-methylbut-2-enyl diphosphate reductase